MKAGVTQAAQAVEGTGIRLMAIVQHAPLVQQQGVAIADQRAQAVKPAR